MLLAININNTETKVGLFRGDSLEAHWRLTTTPSRTPDEWAATLTSYLAQEGRSTQEVRAAVVASVVPPVTQGLCEAVERATTVRPVVVDGRSRLPITLDVEEPLQVGADRILNTRAAGRAAAPPRPHRRRLRHRHDVRLHYGRRPLPRRCDHARDPYRVGRAHSGHRQASRDRPHATVAHHRATDGGGDSVGRVAGHGGRRGRDRAPHQGRGAERSDAAGHRHRRPREPGCAAGPRDRVGASGPHPDRAPHRRHGAGPDVVVGAGALNAWRRWGYRLLPGDLFSYVLHMRPADWPIMAGRTRPRALLGGW